MRDAQLQAEQYASEQLGYKLLSRNCVSELFTTIDMAFAEALRQRGEPVNRNTMERETQQRLGERFTVSPVPFVSADQVQRYWHSEQPQQLLSLRRLYMQSRYREDSTLVPLLRESNTLTSTVYRRSDQDSYFIFFTDGNTWARPALGLVNLTAALGATAVGALQWPFDGGSQLKAGLRGALFSMPELGFINIRKGSSTWLAPPLREVQLQ
jgi:hypothetical protein